MAGPGLSIISDHDHGWPGVFESSWYCHWHGPFYPSLGRNRDPVRAPAARGLGVPASDSATVTLQNFFGSVDSASARSRSRPRRGQGPQRQPGPRAAQVSVTVTVAARRAAALPGTALHSNAAPAQAVGPGGSIRGRPVPAACRVSAPQPPR